MPARSQLIVHANACKVDQYEAGELALPSCIENVLLAFKYQQKYGGVILFEKIAYTCEWLLTRRQQRLEKQRQ
jgi:hypothetical protein